MKAISLWQPFASAYLRDELKVHESRHWVCPKAIIGQRVMIHAAQRVVTRAMLTDETEVATVGAFGWNWRKTLPFGALVGSVVITDCRKMGPFTGVAPAHNLDRIFGLWEDGRFAWRGEDRRLLDTPIPWKGGQGWFNVPDDLVQQ